MSKLRYQYDGILFQSKKDAERYIRYKGIRAGTHDHMTALSAEWEMADIPTFDMTGEHFDKDLFEL